MEGVVVSAKKDGSTISVSVVTDAKGQYAFPADRLGAGHYTLRARAAGYELEAPVAADIGAGNATKSDVKLKKLKNLSGNLTNAEWLMSMPGSETDKKFLLLCVSCHSLERVVRSSHDAEEFSTLFGRMFSYYPGSTPFKPQPLVGDAVRIRNRGDSDKAAQFLASINLSTQDSWNYELKTLPRLTGKSTKVIITEYDLPNKVIQPHDVVLDRKGDIWYSDFGQMFMGKVDQKTGATTQYPIPVTKPGYPEGTLDLEIDAEDNLWIGVMYQNAIAKFDKKTETFKVWSTPKEWDSDSGQLGHLAVNAAGIDGKVWIKNSAEGHIYRLDVESNKFENLGAFKDPRNGRRIGTYGLHADSQNNVYLLDFANNGIVKIDAKTKKTETFFSPTPDSRPRRGRIDHLDRLWFAEYLGERIAMLDSKSAEIKEYKLPTVWSAPYDVVMGKDGAAWAGSMVNDRVARLDTATGEFIEYQMPRSTNIRRVWVDDTKSGPATLWIGNNLGASIIKVEPILD